jgi:phospholipid/cholesterol/gamma-HCH transport system substrate-binding protein
MRQPRMSCRTALAALALLAGGALLSRFVLSPPRPDDQAPRRPAGPRPVPAAVAAGGDRVAAAGGIADVRRLVAAAPPAPPTVQESLQKMQKSLERLERLAPTTEEALRESSDLARELRKTTIPDLQKTNEELRKLIKDVDETVAPARKALEESTKTLEEARKTFGDFGTASRNWAQVGERVNVLLQTNEENLQSIVKNTTRLLSEDNVKDINTILGNFRISSERFPTISKEADKFFREGQSTQAQLKRTLEKQEDLIDQLRGTREQGRGAVREFNEGAVKFNKLMGEARELLRAVAQSDGTVRRLIAEPSLFNHLDDTALMMKRIVPRMDRVLKDFEVFADKLARHPEALGLGGVVRPSTGIKEAPSRTHYPTTMPPTMLPEPWKHP